MIKVLERLGIQETYLNIIRTVFSKPIANIKLNEEKFSNSTKIRSKKGCACSPNLFNMVLEVLARVRGQLKAIKRIQFGKKEVKPSLVAGSIMVYTSNHRNLTRKLLQLKKYLQSCVWIQD